MRAFSLTQGVIAALLLCAGADGRRQHFRKFRNTVAALNNDYTGPYDALAADAACAVPPPPEVKAPKKNIWSFLSRDEKRGVLKWLKDQNFPNTTIFSGAGLMTPNKTDVSAFKAVVHNMVADYCLLKVLAYLDGNGPEPVRYASVEITENSGRRSANSTARPTYASIIVGPLPVSNATTWQYLTYPYTRADGKIRVLFGDLDYRKYRYVLHRPSDYCGHPLTFRPVNLTRTSPTRSKTSPRISGARGATTLLVSVVIHIGNTTIVSPNGTSSGVTLPGPSTPTICYH